MLKLWIYLPLVLEGVETIIEYFALQIGGALGSYASTSFTLGGGLTYTATSETIISTGLTITGVQILQVLGILSRIIIMATS